MSTRFVGASLALKRNEHFALEIVIAILPGALRRVMHGAALLMVLIFCVLLVVYGLRLATESWRVTTAVLEISRTWLYAAVPFGGVLMLLRTLEAIGRFVRDGAAARTRDQAEPNA